MDIKLQYEHESGRCQTWDNADPDLHTFVDEIVSRISNLIKPENFVGAYLHGSFAMGSFYRPKSDLDILFVVRQPLSSELRCCLALELCDLSDKPLVGDIETSIVRLEHTVRFPAHMPYELHYSQEWKVAIREKRVEFENPGSDGDLAVHCSVIRARGICLSGTGIDEVFGPVPVEICRDSILGDLQWILEGNHIAESPFYGVLNCCRVLALFSDGWHQVLSKDEGGEWALVHLPVAFKPVVLQALACYRSPASVASELRRTDGHEWDIAALQAFRDFVRRWLRENQNIF